MRQVTKEILTYSVPALAAGALMMVLGHNYEASDSDAAEVIYRVGQYTTAAGGIGSLWSGVAGALEKLVLKI